MTRANMEQGTIESLAARLRKAETERMPIAPLRNELVNGGIEAAYEVQRTNTRYWTQSGKRVVGRKIGLTSKAVQDQLGVRSPDFGTLFADMALYDGEEVAPDRVLQPKIEAEVALVLDKDLSRNWVTPSELISAVAYALPAIEIVGSRIEGWNINLLDTVADNASSGLFVLGNQPVRLNKIDLRACQMVMECEGRKLSDGSGSACLGNPLNAAIWLARTMVDLGTPLMAGDVVMTGALGAMVSISRGATYDVRIEGLGNVRAVFAA